MGKKVTMQQIADRLGLSKYTVSQSFAGKPGVSHQTRRQVLEMARTLGYVASEKRGRKLADLPKLPEENARWSSDGDAPGAHNRQANKPFIVVWIQGIQAHEPTFWERVLSGIDSGCEYFGWGHLVMSSSDKVDKPIDFPVNADRNSCIGGLVLGTWPAPAIISVKLSGLPLVLVDHEEPLAELDCIVNANFDAAKKLCRRMIASGCRKLAFVGNDKFSVSFQERWWGCKMAVEQIATATARMGASGTVDTVLKKWTISYHDGGQWKTALSRKLAGIPIGELPDCFICANDNIALELLAMLQKLGISVPEQCKVVGFDNIGSTAHCEPGLTTVDLGKEELGFRAVEALERRVRKPGSPCEKVVLAARLVIRGSG